MAEINLYFWKLAFIKFDCNMKFVFDYYKNEKDIIINLGRYEFYIIPRNSKTFNFY